MLGFLRLALVVAAVPLVSGCFYLPPLGGLGSGRSSDAEVAQARLRNAVVALEAYFADNGTYAEASLDVLRAGYDPSLENVLILRADAETYCAEVTVGAETFSRDGPAAEIVPGGC